MANSRAEYLVEILREANNIHFPRKNLGRDSTVKEKKMIPRASENLALAKHGLRNILQGKTLESEAKEVLKMEEKDKIKYFMEVFHSGGNGALKELYKEIDKQKKPTFTIPKTVEAQVKEVMELNAEWRKRYYQSVFDSLGKKAANELVAAVKKERTRSQGMEM